jgi:hypothetical protein
MNKPTHGGKRKGAGRKPAAFPVFLKKFRATEADRKEFLDMLTGDANIDFLILLNMLRHFHGKPEETIAFQTPKHWK